MDDSAARHASASVRRSGATPKRNRRLLHSSSRARIWLTLYGFALAAIAFWPVRVDSGMRPTLRSVSHVVPWLTYDVVEFTANVLLFVPFGALLYIGLPRLRLLVLPIALAVSVAIEAIQAEFLDDRVASVRDVVANMLGAVIGLFIAWVIARRAKESRPVAQ